MAGSFRWNRCSIRSLAVMSGPKRWRWPPRVRPDRPVRIFSEHRQDCGAPPCAPSRRTNKEGAVMENRQRRQYEMLLRVRDFGDTHRALFSPASAAPQTFTTLGAAIDELTAADVKKQAASASARAGRKDEARRALADVLTKVSLLARVLRAGGRAVPPFALPNSKSDQVLLTTGRQFANEMPALDAEFTGHGLGSARIAEATAAFEAAVRDRGMERADHVAARTRIQDLLASALRDVRRLDLMVSTDLQADTVSQAVWQQARRGGGTRGGRARGGAGNPGAAAGAAA